jgi:caa(3)-type oxidase subunit IV
MASKDHSEEHHGPKYYYKIYYILLVLLVISVVGPELGHRGLTLFTAFGIAIIKALMVAAYFMHLNVEKKYIWYMMITMLLMVGMFFLGTVADTMKPEGQNWSNEAAKALIEEHKGSSAGAHHP